MACSGPVSHLFTNSTLSSVPAPHSTSRSITHQFTSVTGYLGTPRVIRCHGLELFVIVKLLLIFDLSSSEVEQEEKAPARAKMNT